MANKPHISIEEFAKLDMRVGLVVDACPVPDSKKLIKLSVDLGSDYEQVTILTGLLVFYPDPTVFIGKKYVFLPNLAPRMMAGIESQGMFFAIDSGTGDPPAPLEVATHIPVGAVVG
ncbi:MAG TPA: methionine--tRNA ligase [Candidatus Woesebacteria bacterium]|nr:methionine--tRNA ligase [Candidatus Woesebacteria bacterium]HNS94629.1 methionine--tRNA ligase [Candidatus Woesebacteria bacterium]